MIRKHFAGGAKSISGWTIQSAPMYIFTTPLKIPCKDTYLNSYLTKAFTYTQHLTIVRSVEQ